MKGAMSVPVCPPDSLCCKIKRWTQTLSETTSMHGLAWYNRLDLQTTFFFKLLFEFGEHRQHIRTRQIVQALFNSYCMRKIFCLHRDSNPRLCLLAWASPSLQGFASLRSITLPLLVACTLDDLENCYCSHLLHYPEHVLPVE